MRSVSLLLLILWITLSAGSAVAASQQLSIVSQNLNRFFDNKDDGHQEKRVSVKKYNQRLNQLVKKIAVKYQFADVIAFQEVENKTILQDVSNLLKKKHSVTYRAILREGNDISGIDVGYLVKQNLNIKSVKQLFANQSYIKKPDRLFSRPPLAVELCIDDCVTLVNLHLRSMRGLRSARQQKKVATKRRLQAETLARWINKFQTRHDRKKLIVLGDFNALSPSDNYVDTLGTILGKPDTVRPKWKSPDLIEQDLVDASKQVPANRRYSYLYKGIKQQLDYLLVNKPLKNKIKSISFSWIDFKFSDHAALKARIQLD